MDYMLWYWGIDTDGSCFRCGSGRVCANLPKNRLRRALPMKGTSLRIWNVKRKPITSSEGKHGHMRAYTHTNAHRLAQRWLNFDLVRELHPARSFC